jgi:hypothetical protein
MSADPPSGATPPFHAFTSDGFPIGLRALAVKICARYRDEFPDEQERYGAAGIEWCLHDNQYLLAWAIQDARDATVVLAEQAVWLARVLKARDFPLERLARNLEIASEVTRTSLALGALADETSQNLARAAATIAQLESP